MFIIQDGSLGWACYNGIEGWHFTTLQTAATRFNTREQAKEAISKHYPNDSKHLTVKSVDK